MSDRASSKLARMLFLCCNLCFNNVLCYLIQIGDAMPILLDRMLAKNINTDLNLPERYSSILRLLLFDDDDDNGGWWYIIFCLYGMMDDEQQISTFDTTSANNR